MTLKHLTFKPPMERLQFIFWYYKRKIEIQNSNIHMDAENYNKFILTL